MAENDFSSRESDSHPSQDDDNDDNSEPASNYRPE